MGFKKNIEIFVLVDSVLLEKNEKHGQRPIKILLLEVTH